MKSDPPSTLAAPLGGARPDLASEVERLIAIMAALRNPVTGCPWDIEQSFATIAPYTIEEAYEVADAIARGDMVDLVDELGDLLLQVAFHARLAEEAGHFAFIDAVKAINAKMIRRHPHVFGDVEARTAGMAKGAWNAIKAQERAEKAARRSAAGLVDNAPHGKLGAVPTALPGLTRAVKLQEAASKVGFDWKNPRGVLAKIREELDEFEAALDMAEPAAQQEEWGDIAFALANLARHLAIDPEAALRATNQKFIRRFGHIETELAARGRSPEDATLAEMEALWLEAKTIERA